MDSRILCDYHFFIHLVRLDIAIFFCLQFFLFFFWKGNTTKNQFTTITQYDYKLMAGRRATSCV
ncbi:hypothetical protein Hanom_Chr16g01416061 [Helianthus anomalus]